MQITYPMINVHLPEDYVVDAMDIQNAYWVVPVEIICPIIDDGKSNTIAGVVKVNVNGPRSMSLDAVQQKAGEYMKFAFSFGSEVGVNYK